MLYTFNMLKFLSFSLSGPNPNLSCDLLIRISLVYTSHEREGQYGFTHPEGCPEGSKASTWLMLLSEYDSVFFILTLVAGVSMTVSFLNSTG